jgi:signal transduction histidine kinase
VEKIGDGNLEDEVSVVRSDEIGQLAAGINFMRNQLMEHKKTEEKMKQAQAELVLGMAHDLRTPLTGLFSYLEIIQKLEKEGKPALEYAAKSLDKAEQLRSVSDQLFEYFLASNESETELEEPETVQSAFEDYLSEFCAFLQCNGFCVDTEELSWQPVKVRLNTDFFGRIMNNLISNIEKYADKQAPVQIKIVYADAHIELDFQNRIITPNPYVKGTGIGLKNIELMMKQMEGSSKVVMTEDTYHIRLIFPVIR